jgi:uncharacterized protein
MQNVEMGGIIKKSKSDKRIMAVALFGSTVKNKNGRDIDLCIFTDKKYSNLEMSKIRLNFLKDLTNKFDVQIFQQLPVYIRIRVLKEGKILFCKNSDLLYEIAFTTIKDFGFYKKIYDLYLSEIKNG